MAEYLYVPDVAGFQKEFRSWNGSVGKHMVKVTTKATVLAKKSAPGPGKRPRNRTGLNYATGNLQVQILSGRGRWGGELEGRVIALPKYSLFVHEGTKPHMIFPKKPGGHLRFFWPKAGKVVYLKKVKHPGTRRIPFLAENLREAVRG